MTDLCQKSDVEALTQVVYSSSTTPTTTQISDWIALISQRLEEDTRKKYSENTATDEYHDGNGTQYIMMNNSPITSVTSLVVDDATLVQNTGYWIIDAMAGVIECLVTPSQRTDGELTGHRNIKCTYKYGVSAIPSAVRELAAVMVAIKAVGAECQAEDSDTLKSYSDGDVSITYSEGNVAVQALLAQYNELRKQVPSRINMRTGGLE